MPTNAKRALPADRYDQAGPLKKAKACSAPAGPIDDDEEYCSAVETVTSGLNNELKAEEEGAELKTEIKADNNIVKADEDVIKTDNDAVMTHTGAQMKIEIKQENDAVIQTGIKAGKPKVEVIELEEDED